MSKLTVETEKISQKGFKFKKILGKKMIRFESVKKDIFEKMTVTI